MTFSEKKPSLQSKHYVKKKERKKKKTTPNKACVDYIVLYRRKKYCFVWGFFYFH